MNDTRVRGSDFARARGTIIAVCLGVLGLAAMAGVGLTPAAAQGGYLMPDLQTVVPGQLMPVVRDGITRLTFTNVIANLGVGRFQILGVHSPTTTAAYQQLLNAADQVIAQFPVSTFAFHPTHGHWHIDNVADYKLRAGALDGAVVSQFTKVTFCMIDVERLLPKPGAGERRYFGCNDQLQGITNGWGDEYVRSLPGQELVVTGLPAGIYYLVSVADPANHFIESNDDNNTAWLKIRLTYVSGAPKVEELDHSDCQGIMCGARK